eukprot:CAMPEP_0113632830 /NCGR_PEP_ID=MMETSP0017_2-20120614/17072_1 /TAXON_ID=2856 /ORGANISM="Cylindrotheca closterium" /LENGTH=144 /DNA_ID=CAMNT_0000543417 /DNA_START=76 /DNA_END=510 /DNA_ORIENTATION=+ /assembly_acc=CAM_ASM_000147
MTAATRFPIYRRRPRSYSRDSEILVQPTKPKQLMKPKLEIRSKKVSVLSENNAFRATETNQTRKGPLDTSSNSIPSIFVKKTFNEDVNDNWTLKRASPVYDSDDDDEDFIVMNCSPAKKQRTTSLTLDWGNRLPDENNGFTIKL